MEEQTFDLSHLLQKNEKIRWFELFESVDAQLGSSFKKTTPETLAAALTRLKPYVEREEITFDLFIDNALYLKAAYLLGVRKYQPRFKDDTLALAILENDSIAPDQKQQLFEWMLQEKIYSTNPLTVPRICKALIKGDCSIGCFLRNLPLADSEDFPNPNPAVASNGNIQQNILHAAVYNGGVLQMWKSLRKIFSTDELVQMLLQVNKRGKSALFLILSNYFNDANRMPNEVTAAMVAIAKLGDFSMLNNFDMIQENIEKSSLILLLYKYGMTPDKIPPITDEQPMQFYHEENNPFAMSHQLFRWKNVKQTTIENGTCQQISDPANSFPIDQLLPELMTIIAEYLDPQGAVGLLSLNKKMSRSCQQTNEYWKRLFTKYYFPNFKIHNYMKAVRTNLVCSANMTQRNFTKITLENFSAKSLMDENWLVLYKGKDIYLWNCHTQTTHLIYEGEQLEFFKPIAILGGRYDGTIPPILMVNDAQNVSYGVIENGTFRQLPDIQHVPAGTIAKQMDEHYIVFPNFEKYDMRTWTKVVMEPAMDFIPSGVLYNPFNDTLLAVTSLFDIGKTAFRFFDKDQKLLRKWESAKDYFNAYMLIDENLVLNVKTRLFTLIDFSSDPVKETKLPIFGLGKVVSQRSKDRIIFADSRTGLVSICHLPSLQWETVYHLQASVIVSNSRYIVGNEEGSTIIYDFLK